MAILVLRGPGFSNPGQVQYNNVGCSARLKTSFELNPVTEGKQRTFPFLSYPPADQSIKQLINQSVN